MAIKGIEGYTISYSDKIEDAEEFLYIMRTSIYSKGVYIYSKTGSLCHKFSQVDRVGKIARNGQVFRKSGLPDKHWLIADKVISCQVFDHLMSFVVDHCILEMPSLEEAIASITSYDIIGVRTKGNSEHWYMVDGIVHEKPEHEAIMAELLSGEEGRQFQWQIQM